MIKKTNKKNNTEKPVTKCDQSKEVVAKCEHPEGVAANCDRKNINIESLIRTIRGHIQNYCEWD